MALELADIFREYGDAYRQKYAIKLLASHRQAMRAIEQCRTQALGGQLYSCSACGELGYSYHSCRNRHCPKCQHEQAQEWLHLQERLLLQVPYFLLTFTLPAELRILASRNQKLFYTTLFRASAEATQELARATLHWWADRFGGRTSYLDPQSRLPSTCSLSRSGRWIEFQS